LGCGPDACQVCPGKQPGVRTIGKYAALSDAFDDEWCMPIPRMKVNFERRGAVPVGWRKTLNQVPEAFLFAGGDACVIAEAKDETKRRVLLALPDWTVDLQRARWLERMRGRFEDTSLLAKPLRIIPEADILIFEFEYPSGISLADWVRKCGYMPEVGANVLYKDLMGLSMEFQSSMMRLWGFVDSRMVMLSPYGRLAKLLPLGCLLSFRGATAVVMHNAMAGNRLAPELAQALAEGNRAVGSNRDLMAGADAYAVAMVTLEALAGRQEELGDSWERSAEWERKAVDSLTETASDLFHKALYEDPAWRLSVDDALEHPWLTMGVQPASGRTSKKEHRRVSWS